MAQYADFSLFHRTDGTLTINMNPQVPIGGWTIVFAVSEHFGSDTPYILKSVASGFNGMSGISIVSSGQGQFNVAINANDTSGLTLGNYAYAAQRVDSGSRTVLTEGFFSVLPDMGGN